MLRPGDRLFVYGVAGEHPSEADLPAGLAGVLDDGGWSYLVYTRDVGADLDARGVEVVYDASIPYEDWLDGDAREPFEAGGVTIVPPWSEAPSGTSLVLHVEPSLAFGTGAHPTTRRCLELLPPLVASGGPAPTILDLGCGTGTLSLAALRLGAERALGCDVSRLAVETARRNARRNGLAHRTTFRCCAASDLEAEADLVLANLPPSCFREGLRHRAVSRARFLLLSGMLESQAREIRDALPPGLELVELHADGPWRTALLRAR